LARLTTCAAYGDVCANLFAGMRKKSSSRNLSMTAIIVLAALVCYAIARINLRS
jgi:hypothetical protein